MVNTIECLKKLVDELGGNGVFYAGVLCPLGNARTETLMQSKPLTKVMDNIKEKCSLESAPIHAPDEVGKKENGVPSRLSKIQQILTVKVSLTYKELFEQCNQQGWFKDMDNLQKEREKQAIRITMDSLKREGVVSKVGSGLNAIWVLTQKKAV